jgi:hypothetical protein
MLWIDIGLFLSVFPFASFVFGTCVVYFILDIRVVATIWLLKLQRPSFELTREMEEIPLNAGNEGTNGSSDIEALFNESDEVSCESCGGEMDPNPGNSELAVTLCGGQWEGKTLCNGCLEGLKVRHQTLTNSINTENQIDSNQTTWEGQLFCQYHAALIQEETLVLAVFQCISCPKERMHLCDSCNSCVHTENAKQDHVPVAIGTNTPWDFCKSTMHTNFARTAVLRHRFNFTKQQSAISIPEHHGSGKQRVGRMEVFTTGTSSSLKNE